MNFNNLARKFSYLKIQLAEANINLTIEQFLRKIFINSLIVSITLTLSSLMIFSKLDINLLIGLLLFPFIFGVIFFFFLNSPRSKANKITREIDGEIVYAGRFLLIELSSGVSLFEAIKNISNAYPVIGKYFKQIVDKVESGKPMEVALSEVSEITPSTNFRKLLFQIINSMKTGADISKSLEGITEQISKEQLIKIKEYGKKLNPMVLFYLLIAIIMPSLGVAILSLVSTFTGFSLSLANLIGINFGIAILQFMFLSIIIGLRKGL
jgi:flagellar protein FlaJ